MKTLALSMVKNEGDFIESFIRLNARNIDRFLIVDDASSDATLPILAELIREGFPIQLFTVRAAQLGLEQQQGGILSGILAGEVGTDAATDVATNAAFDFAFLLDADEILLSDRATTEAQLRRLGPQQVGQIPWVTHVPTMADTSTSTHPVRDGFRPIRQESMQYHKAVIPRGAAAGAAIVPGNHGITRHGQMVTDTLVLDLPLGHFPIRNAAQLMAKALIGSHKLSIKSNRLGGEGYHWDWLAQRLRASGYRIDFDELQRIAASYPLVDRAPATLPALGEPYPLPDVASRCSRPADSALARVDAFLLELCRDYRARVGGGHPSTPRP